MEAKTLAWQAKNNQPVQTSHRFVAESVLRFLGTLGDGYFCVVYTCKLLNQHVEGALVDLRKPNQFIFYLCLIFIKPNPSRTSSSKLSPSPETFAHQNLYP